MFVQLSYKLGHPLNFDSPHVFIKGKKIITLAPLERYTIVYYRLTHFIQRNNAETSIHFFSHTVLTNRQQNIFQF